MTAPMSVSLDVSAVPPAPAGAGRYTVELAGALGRRDDVTTVLVSRQADRRRWEELAAAVPPGTRVVAAAPNRRPLRLAWEQALLPRLVDRTGVAVHHGPHYTMPERARVPTVVTIHDCTFFDHPEWHERAKAFVFRRAIRRAARRAAALVCVSRTTAERLERVCDVRAPVFVAPHGVDLGRFSATEPDVGFDDGILGSLGMDPERPFVAFVGTIEPRKNVAGLVAAFGRIAPACTELTLVLAGQPGWAEADVARAIARSSHAGRIRRLGYVPDAAVPALLRQAAVVAYPSLAEGYGLPALEALACGAPLVTTAGTAMAEMAGGAAVLVPAGDTDALAGALRAVVEGGDDRRSGRRALGLQVASARTWDASADDHMAAYRWAARAPRLGRASAGPSSR